MAIPILFGAVAVATGVTGLGKGVKGAIDTKEASDVQERAERILRNAQSSMEVTKDKTNFSIQELGKSKIQASARELNDFVDLYTNIKGIELSDSIGLDELKKLNITKDNISEMRETALGAIDVLSGGITGVGAGVLLGWGTYGGVMALGTASTGAAIGGLSGVAATNATLAWLGGGAIAAGGGGMALGTMVLGGIIAGPALLVAGGIFGSKAKSKLNNAYSNLSESKRIASEIELAEDELKIIIKNADQLNRIINAFVVLLRKANSDMKLVVERSCNWSEYSKEEKNIVISAMKGAQVVKTIIDVPLLTENGVLTRDIKDVLENRELLSMAGL